MPIAKLMTQKISRRGPVDPERVRELRDQGLQVIGIAAALQCSQAHVQRILNQTGPRIGCRKIATKVDLTRLRELNAQGLSDAKIGAILGCTGEAIWCLRKKMSLRPGTEKRAQTVKRDGLGELLAHIARPDSDAAGRMALACTWDEENILRKIGELEKELAGVRAKRMFAEECIGRREQVRRALREGAVLVDAVKDATSDPEPAASHRER